MKLCIKNIFRQWIFLIEVQWDLQGWNFKSQSLQPLQDIALQVVQALFGKFKKWSKILASVLKTCVYDVRSSKKNWAQLDDPLPSYSKNKFIDIWLSNLPFARQFADLKKFTWFLKILNHMGYR